MNTFIDAFSLLFMLMCYAALGFAMVITIDFCYFKLTKKSILVMIENKLFGPLK